MDNSLEAALAVIAQQQKQIAQLEATLEYRKAEEGKQRDYYEEVIKQLKSKQQSQQLEMLK